MTSLCMQKKRIQSIIMQYLLFSSVGLYIEDHPIYDIAADFRPAKIEVFTSDEPISKGMSTDESSERNIHSIQAYFKRTNTKVTAHKLKMEEFEKNTFFITKTIIGAIIENPGIDVIVDLSTGRMPIKFALSRAAYMVDQYFSEYKTELKPNVTVVLKPEGYPKVSYSISLPNIPTRNDLELLETLPKFPKMSQKGIASKLKWGHQTTVSRALKTLRQQELVENDSKRITERGKRTLELLKYFEGINA